MMRPISLLCMLLAIGSGLYLYRVKYHAQLLDREINLTLRGADDAMLARPWCGPTTRC